MLTAALPDRVRNRRLALALVLAVAALAGAMALAACQDTSGLSGTVEIDGSSTVFPIMEAVAEEFSLEHRGARVTVGVSGTGGGFKRFCNGETDISNASRPIKPSEIELCAEEGVEFVEIPIAFDGLTIVVNPDNQFVDLLTLEELNRIWRPNDPAERWSDVRPVWPDEAMELFGPGVDSGTFDYFTETVNGAVGAIRTDFTASEDDNLLVLGVSGERFGLGYFGISFFENNKEILHAVPIDGGAGPVLPSAETINDGSYSPLSRPLLIYVRAASLAEPVVQEFIAFLLTLGRTLVDDPEIGYVQLPEELYALGLERARGAVTGSLLQEVEPGADLVALYGGG